MNKYQVTWAQRGSLGRTATIEVVEAVHVADACTQMVRPAWVPDDYHVVSVTQIFWRVPPTE